MNVIREAPKTTYLILIDIDDTMHEAEDHIMRDMWNELLAPWNIVWKPTKYTIPEGQLVTEDERPGVGVRPREVVEHFIQLYGLNPLETSIDALLKLGLSEEQISYMQNRWITLSHEQRVQEWTDMLEGARVGIPERIVKERGVVAIPGSVEGVRSLKRSMNDGKENYGVAFVSSGSETYARAVLDALGLTEGPKNDEKSDYEILIAGDMVQHPKPHREPHDMALAQLHERGEQDNMKYIPVAMIGDSGSDSGFTYAAGIPVILLRDSEHLSPEKKKDMVLQLGRRVHFFNSWDEVTPSMLDTHIATAEGQAPGVEGMI